MVGRQRIEHLGRALRVTDVSNLLLVGHLTYEVNLRHSVIITELLEAKLPEHATPVRIKNLVPAAESRAAIIPKPDVVALTHHLKGRR